MSSQLEPCFSNKETIRIPQRLFHCPRETMTKHFFFFLVLERLSMALRTRVKKILKARFEVFHYGVYFLLYSFLSFLKFIL